MKRRHFVDRDIPHDREVDSLILVNQDVAQTGAVLPRNLRMIRTQLERQTLDRLADDLEVPFALGAR